MSMIQIDHLTFSYDNGQPPVFEDLSLQLDTDWKLGLVGRNGRGKTTLLRLMEGLEEYQGRISSPVTCRRFPCTVEDTRVPAAQVLERIACGVEPWQVQRELSLLGFEEELLERPFASLSGGEQSRILLAALFLDETCYPMLDEPTDHLDSQGRELVAGYLKQTRRGFLAVSHDRAFLDQCVDHVLALNRCGQELVQGNFSVWYREKENRDRREARRNEHLRGEISRLEQAAEARRQKADAVERAKIGGPSKTGGSKSGLRPFLGEKSRKGQQQRKNLERRQQRAIAEKSALLRDIERMDSLKLSPAVHYSQCLLEVQGAAVDYGRGDICREVSFSLMQGERLCLRGANGCGKSSLLRLILGEDIPHRGEIWRASGLKISYISQKTEHLRGPLRDWPERERIDPTLFMTVLRKLDFPRDAFEEDVSSYSSGQKKKVLLAASLCQSAHLYIWDEPLNFIDLFTRIQLEELILRYQPTLLFVEHDQAFEQKIATRSVLVEKV